MTDEREFDRFGLRPRYQRVDRRAEGATIRDLLFEKPGDLTLDPEGVRQRFENRLDGERTCFAAVRSVVSRSPPPIADESLSLLGAVSQALVRVAHKARRPALALSGGLDSAMLLAIICRHELPVHVYTLDASLPGYSEIDATLANAAAIGCRHVRIIRASEADFIGSLPATIRAGEAPLYNAHPVSKLLLARALVAAGVDLVITGDAADQVFAGVDGRDYLPIVGAIFRAAGLRWCAPFAEEAVVAIAGRGVIDANKSALRAAAADLLPASCLEQRKRPTLAPPIDLSGYLDVRKVQRLAEEVDLPPVLETARQRMLWTTLSLLVDAMACAE
jgi:hypothetical protein